MTPDKTSNSDVATTAIAGFAPEANEIKTGSRHEELIRIQRPPDERFFSFLRAWVSLLVAEW
jgi:hypothetical protein